jgi:hypothetical protein
MIEQGLTNQEVIEKRKEYGFNVIDSKNELNFFFYFNFSI